MLTTVGSAFEQVVICGFGGVAMVWTVDDLWYGLCNQKLRKTREMSSFHSVPLLFLNLGGEMMYILNQRLNAQRIPKDKAMKGGY